MTNEKFIQLPSEGRLLVVTDLHGNLEDYKRYLKLWNPNDLNFHLVLVGDYIHSTSEDDGSIEIIEDIMKKYKKCPNFHPLLGNHEWSHIVGSPVFKGYNNQTLEFEELIVEKKGSLEPYLSNYIEFFKSLPYFVKTENGLFISHAGPSEYLHSIDAFNKIFENDYNYHLLHDFLWNRYDRDYYEEDVDDFLKIIGSNCMVVGHTVVEAYLSYGNQLILSSSFATIDKAYLDIDLSKPIDNMHVLLDNIKFLEENDE